MRAMPCKGHSHTASVFSLPLLELMCGCFQGNGAYESSCSDGSNSTDSGSDSGNDDHPGSHIYIESHNESNLVAADYCPDAGCVPDLTAIEVEWVRLCTDLNLSTEQADAASRYFC